VIVNKVRDGKKDFGYNANDNTFANFFEVGIIDPTKVTRLALENAASIAGMLLTTEAVVSDIAEEKEAPAMPHGGGMGGMM
jgi:chaperonin GroEL